MRKILAVIKREYLQIVKTKGFIIGTILGPVLMSLFLIVPILMSVVSVAEQEKIGVIDASGKLFAELDKKMEQKLKDDSRRYLLEEYRLTGDISQLKEALNEKVLAKELSAYLFLPADISEGGEVEYVSEHVSDFDKTNNIRNALNSIIIGKRLKAEGLDPNKVGQLMSRVHLSTKKVSKRGVEEDTGGTFIISYFLVLVLYMTLIFYGQAIMRGVIEEKSSRVVEIVLSSIRPFQLMAGKIIGIGAVGLTQYTIWGLFGIGFTTYGGALIADVFPAAASFKIPSIPAYIFIYFVVFFILGYLLFSTLFAAIGSMVNTEKEAQQFMTPVIMMLVIPLLLIVFIMRSPNSSVSVILSMIPFFTPTLMLLRVCILLPPFIQVGGSIVLMALTTLLMIWLTAKIYRIGLLMYGKRPRIREIIKWMRYK
jgi:ABC-2 type transport system permease protein